MSHEIDISSINTRTDLVVEEVNNNIKNIKKEKYDDINITIVNIDDSNNKYINKKNGTYITIEFNDVTDSNNFNNLEKILINEIRKIINLYNINENDTCLVVGLGNEKSTPDSLGPLTINNVIVTNHFYFLGVDVEDGFRSVAAISPGVMGQTGIETFDIIKSVINEIKPDFIIVIDSLKASSVNRINKTIQITNAGISPGSGIGNNRKEISMDVLNVPVIAIGIPTVVDTTTIVNDTIEYMTKYYSYMKNNINNKVEKLKIVRTNFKDKEIDLSDKKELFGFIGTLSFDELKSYIEEVLIPIGYNMIVTPKDIDFQIKKLSELLSNSINKSLHNNIDN